MSKTTEEQIITREDMQNAYNSFVDAKEELATVKQTIKEAKQEIDQDFKDQLEALETEMADFEGILQRYNSQNKVQSTALADGGTFGTVEKESYEIDPTTDFVDALQIFKNMFPSNWEKFVTGYPKLKTVKVRSLIQDGFLTEDAMDKIGILTNVDKSFEVKPAKK